MDVLAALVYFLAIHRFLALFVLIFVPILFSGTTKAVTAPGSRKHFTVASLSAPLVLYAILNMIFGTFFAVRLVHAVGQPGHATITDTYGTSTQYNHHNVVGYHVLIATAAGRTIQTSFEDDDFIVYPPHNATTYPQTGDRFNVRYLPHFPGDFVIVSNDDSPWANDLRCVTLRSDMAAAESKFNFDNSNPAFRSAAIAAIQAYVSGPCGLSDDDRQGYQHDIESIRQAR